jgi:hypothetical protein
MTGGRLLDQPVGGGGTGQRCWRTSGEVSRRDRPAAAQIYLLFPDFYDRYSTHPSRGAALPNAQGQLLIPVMDLVLEVQMATWLEPVCTHLGDGGVGRTSGGAICELAAGLGIRLVVASTTIVPTAALGTRCRYREVRAGPLRPPRRVRTLSTCHLAIGSCSLLYPGITDEKRLACARTHWNRMRTADLWCPAEEASEYPVYLT